MWAYVHKIFPTFEECPIDCIRNFTALARSVLNQKLISSICKLCCIVTSWWQSSHISFERSSQILTLSGFHGLMIEARTRINTLLATSKIQCAFKGETCLDLKDPELKDFLNHPIEWMAGWQLTFKFQAVFSLVLSCNTKQKAQTRINTLLATSKINGALKGEACLDLSRSDRPGIAELS